MSRTIQLPLSYRGRAVFESIKVATTAVRTPIGDPVTAVMRTRDAIRSLDPDKVGVVVCQEISTGYEKDRGYLRPGVAETEWALMIKYIAPLSKDRLIVYGLPIHYNGVLYNGAVALWNGLPIAVTAKKFLAHGGEYRDVDYFAALTPGFYDPTGFRVNGVSIPFGELVISVGGVRIKIAICEDLWVENGVAATAVTEGVDIIAWLNASHEAVGRHIPRIQLVNTRSLCSSTTIVGSASLGVQGGHHVFGGGSLVSQCGEIVAAGRRFSFSNWQTTTAVVDLHRQRQSRFMSTSHRMGPVKVNLVHLGGSIVCGERPSKPLSTADLMTLMTEDEEAISIVTNWIWDQFVISGQQGILVLNSGGSDSRLTLMLAKLAFKRAWTELGEDGFKAKLQHVVGINEVKSVDQFFLSHAYGPYLTGATSGEKTLNSAKTLGEALGFQFFAGSIVGIEREFNVETGRILGLGDLSWDHLPDGVDRERFIRTLENAPPRSRGDLGWQLANAMHLYYFATSNLNEVWAKYFTLGGDVEGAGAPLAGVSKIRIERMNVLVARELGIYQQIAPFLKMAPMAEIKPESFGQTDDGELGLLIHRERAEQLLVGQDQEVLQAFVSMAHEFTPEDASEEEAHKLWADMAFALAKLIVPINTMQWARMQLAISPVVEAGPRHPGEAESNRRPAVDLSWKGELEGLVSYLRDGCPNVLEQLAARPGMWHVKRLMEGGTL